MEGGPYSEDGTFRHAFTTSNEQLSLQSKITQRYNFLCFHIRPFNYSPKELLRNKLQWNLSIADMLYSGHLLIADTISGNQLHIFY